MCGWSVRGAAGGGQAGSIAKFEQGSAAAAHSQLRGEVSYRQDAEQVGDEECLTKRIVFGLAISPTSFRIIWTVSMPFEVRHAL